MRRYTGMSSQTTCDADDCDEYILTAHSWQPTSAGEAHQSHTRLLAEDGWTDHEARDYCPACSKELTR